MENEIKQRKLAGKINVYKGKPKLWNVLDNSYDADQKVKSQLDVNDSKLVRVLTNHGLDLKDKNRNIESDAEDDVLVVPTKTKYYD